MDYKYLPRCGRWLDSTLGAVTPSWANSGRYQYRSDNIFVGHRTLGYQQSRRQQHLLRRPKRFPYNTGDGNSFYGYLCGLMATSTGANNTFLGNLAGLSATLAGATATPLWATALASITTAAVARCVGAQRGTEHNRRRTHLLATGPVNPIPLAEVILYRLPCGLRATPRTILIPSSETLPALLQHNGQALTRT